MFLAYLLTSMNSESERKLSVAVNTSTQKEQVRLRFQISLIIFKFSYMHPTTNHAQKHTLAFPKKCINNLQNTIVNYLLTSLDPELLTTDAGNPSPPLITGCAGSNIFGRLSYSSSVVSLSLEPPRSLRLLLRSDFL